MNTYMLGVLCFRLATLLRVQREDTQTSARIGVPIPLAYPMVMFRAMCTGVPHNRRSPNIVLVVSRNSDAAFDCSKCKTKRRSISIGITWFWYLKNHEEYTPEAPNVPFFFRYEKKTLELPISARPSKKRSPPRKTLDQIPSSIQRKAGLLRFF